MRKTGAIIGCKLALGVRLLPALLLLTSASCRLRSSQLSDQQIKQALLIYYPKTNEEKLAKMAAIVRGLPSEEQLLFQNHIQPWSGNLAETRRANEWLRNIRARNPELFKRFRETTLVALNNIRYADEDVSVDQFTESLTRQYPHLDSAHVAAWRQVADNLSPEQRKLVGEYLLMLELGKTVPVGSGKRFSEWVKKNPAAFKGFKKTLAELNKALAGQAQMQVIFDTYNETDWVLRSLVSPPDQAAPSNSEESVRMATATLTKNVER